MQVGKHKHSTHGSGDVAAAARTHAARAGVVIVPKLHRQLDDHPHADGDEAQRADLGHDLGQVGLLRAGRQAGGKQEKQGGRRG